MDPTLFQIGAAIVMVAVSVAILVWFIRYLRVTSERRLMLMLKRTGVDPEIIAQGDTETIFKDVRSRCRKCQSEDLCERWLAGEVEGGNAFCPNARIFSILKYNRGQIPDITYIPSRHRQTS